MLAVIRFHRVVCVANFVRNFLYICIPNTLKRSYQLICTFSIRIGFTNFGVAVEKFNLKPKKKKEITIKLITFEMK